MPLELADALVATEAELLLQAEATVRGYCGWHIAPSRTDTVTVYPDGRGVILLPTLNLTAVTSITETGQAALTADAYRVYAHGEIRRLGYWYWQTNTSAVSVVFVHGYAMPPADVTQVVQALASRAAGNAAGLKSKTAGPFSETYSTELLPLERATLARYRIPPRT